VPLTLFFVFFIPVGVGDFGIPPESLDELSNQFSKEKYFWFACQSQTAPFQEELKGFSLIF
jgi:hypothetical protein